MLVIRETLRYRIKRLEVMEVYYKVRRSFFFKLFLLRNNLICYAKFIASTYCCSPLNDLQLILECFLMNFLMVLNLWESTICSILFSKFLWINDNFRCMTFTLRLRRAKHAGRICKMYSLFFSRKLDRAILKLFMCRQSESFESRGYRIVKIGYMYDNTCIDYFR